MKTFSPWLALLLLAAVAPAVLPKFLLLQLSMALCFALAILGLNLLLGFAGQVCLAQGALFAVGAYTTAILSAQAGWHPLATLLPAAGAAALAGLAIGLPALRLGGLQLAIVTFGVAVLVPQLILKFDRLTQGVTGISFDAPVPPRWLPATQDVWLYGICVAAVALCMGLAMRVLRGDTGRSLRAMRDNELIACSMGVHLVRLRLSAFALSSAFAGLGGGLYAILNGYVSPQSFLAAKSIEILIGAIVGGIASLPGALLGALFVVFVPEWTADLSPALGGLIYGACLIGMMLVARDGLAGLAARGFARWRKSFFPTRPLAAATLPQETTP
ncbi:branched-chain amino acid ABC transporter permease [Variovorax sp. Root318D1]|uniref:branched-chain amino acid ABC transporter permease n=1 Tax=Variovorax sp. Root318D1 TaxID=1736513 RepID=UPI0009EA21FC|nr:branched-chain amino acid ABC transporter permease [Variovorax sp. Root318D1]